jgi:hypothetical protein
MNHINNKYILLFMDNKNIPCNYRSRQLLFTIIDKIKKKDFDENYIYFASLLLSWINTDGSIFLYSNKEEIKNNQKYKYYAEDNFATFLNLWKIYFTSIKDCKDSINEEYITEINNKKNHILTSFLQFGINFPYKFKNNFIDYNKINVDEIITNIKKLMIDTYRENIYSKSDFDDYSFIKYKEQNQDTKCAINNNTECCIHLGKPKFYLFSFKTLKKGENFIVLDKIMNITNLYDAENNT